MNKRTHVLRVEPDGEIIKIHSDEDTALSEGAALNIARASDVEFNNLLGCWEATIRYESGSIYQVLTGFATRQEALDAEVAYLEERLKEDKV